jgi:hypothetical protein
VHARLNQTPSLFPSISAFMDRSLFWRPFMISLVEWAKNVKNDVLEPIKGSSLKS